MKLIRKIYELIMRFLRTMGKNHVGAYAAQAAYFFILSLFPFLILMLTLIQYTGLSQDALIRGIDTIFPSVLDGYIISLVNEIYRRGLVTISISAIMTAWSACKAFLSLTYGMNVIYGIRHQNNYFRLRIRSAVYTVLFIVALILSLVLLVFGSSAYHFMVGVMPFLGNLSFMVMGIKNILTILIFTIFFTLLYWLVPDKRLSLLSQLPGGLFSGVGWFLFSTIFSFYVDSSKGFANTYGSLTMLILLMLWLYFSMYLLLIGAEINVFCYKDFRKIRESMIGVNESEPEEYKKEIEEEEQIEFWNRTEKDDSRSILKEYRNNKKDPADADDKSGR